MGNNYWNRWSIKHWQERGKMGRGGGGGGDVMWLEAVSEERRAESLGAYNLASARPRSRTWLHPLPFYGT